MILLGSNYTTYSWKFANIFTLIMALLHCIFVVLFPQIASEPLSHVSLALQPLVFKTQALQPFLSAPVFHFNKYPWLQATWSDWDIKLRYVAVSECGLPKFITAFEFFREILVIKGMPRLKYRWTEATNTYKRKFWVMQKHLNFGFAHRAG